MVTVCLYAFLGAQTYEGVTHQGHTSKGPNRVLQALYSICGFRAEGSDKWRPGCASAEGPNSGF